MNPMKANIMIRHLPAKEPLNTIFRNLSSIQGVTDLKVDLKNCRLSFVYETEEAALSLLEKLRDLGDAHFRLADRGTCGLSPAEA